jgi:beta-galactosidase/beta-glucuronidase
MLRFALFSLLLGAAVWAQPVPRPEIPNPQFERPLWVSLNGPWEFEFDDGNVGLAENWAAGGKKFSRTITVPYCFESKLSGIGDTGFHPTVWYRKSVTLPANFNGKRVLLRFGAVDYHAQVWVNGRWAAEHWGGSVPFAADMTPYLKSGPNVITVRAFDPPTDRSIPRGKQYWELKSKSIFYTRTSGIWQPVWLEASGASMIDWFRFNPDLDGGVPFEMVVDGPNADLVLEAEVSFEGKPLTRTWAKVDGARIRGGFQVPDPQLWSVERPRLYDVTFTLKKGDETVDRVKTYFGIRKVAIENGRVTLNGRPVYLKFVLDQGYWPESILTPPTDEAIQYDIKMTKEMGFNGARKHQKVEDPRYLYWADKMGFLVSGEAANSYLYDETYVGRFNREWTEAVLRDINHPSIIMWAPLNESWGVPNLRDPRQQAHLRTLYHLTKSLDPTRPVIDNEGWQHTEATDLFAVHDYTANREGLAARWKGVEVKPGATLPPHGVPYLAPGQVYNGTPLYLSEFGGIAFIPQGQQVPQESWGYSGIEKSVDSVLNRLRGQYQAIQQSPIIGVCYTQLTDVEQEVNGLMTYDRKPKFPAEELRQINALLQ